MDQTISYTDCVSCVERFFEGEPMEIIGGMCEPCRCPECRWVCAECGAKRGALHKTSCARTLDVLSSECVRKEVK